MGYQRGVRMEEKVRFGRVMDVLWVLLMLAKDVRDARCKPSGWKMQSCFVGCGGKVAGAIRP